MAEKIQTALDLIKQPGGLPMRDKADFERFNAETAARFGKIGQKASNVVTAYINYNRWVADCPNCGAGIACVPDCSQAVCLECGERYDVSFPDATTREAIEALLLMRPQRNRHWRPGETIEDLERENRDHGIEPYCALCRQRG